MEVTYDSNFPRLSGIALLASLAKVTVRQGRADLYRQMERPTTMPTVPMMQQSTMKKLTPVIMVDAIEPCLPFWDRLGFAKIAEVPEGDRLGFVILMKDGIEVMYQTHESVEKDAPGLVPRARGHGMALFIEVTDVATVERALDGIEIVVP